MFLTLTENKFLLNGGGWIVEIHKDPEGNKMFFNQKLVSEDDLPSLLTPEEQKKGLDFMQAVDKAWFLR